jgi:L-aminopeptidase/D-esterase-like protein
MQDGTFRAWESERDDEFGGLPPPAGRPDAPAAAVAGGEPVPGANTTLAVVATDLALSRADALRVATMAQDGLARAIRPVHTPYDGDTVFVLSTGARRTGADPAADVARVGAVAADCVARAIARGVYAAETLGDLVAWKERYG